MRLFGFTVGKSGKYPPHVCESDHPVAVVPIPGVFDGRVTTKTAILYRCGTCFNVWEEIFNGLYTLKDFENPKKYENPQK